MIRSKKVLSKFIIFFVPFIMLFIIFETKLKKVENTYILKKRYLENTSSGIEVLILGSSHSLYGINPNYFNKKGFNLSNVSQSLYYDKEVLKKYCNSLYNLKTVILNISYFSLEYELEDSPEYWRTSFYKIFYDIPSNKNDFLNINNYSLFFLYGNKQSFYYLINDCKEYYPLNQNGSMFYKDDESLAKTDSAGIMRIIQHKDIMNTNIIGKNISYIYDIIYYLKEKNINIVFVTTPTYYTYHNNVDFRILKLNEYLITNIANEYNIRYLNYFKDLRFTENDYYDNDHLNVSGQMKFTLILKNELNL